MSKKNDILHAEKLYENGKYTEALEAFKNISEGNSDYNILNYVGCCYLQLKKYDKAKTIFEKLMADNPENCQPLYNIGRVYFQQGKTNEAFAYLKKAIEISPDNADAYFYLGVYSEKQKNYNEAIKYYKKAAGIDFFDYETHMNLSRCLKYTEDIDGALNEARIAFKLSDDRDTLYNLTYLLNITNAYEEAYELLKNIETDKCDDEFLILNLMHSAKKLNDIQICLKCAERILELNPGNKYAIAVMQNLK